jgi:hypothetical protein
VYFLLFVLIVVFILFAASGAGALSGGESLWAIPLIIVSFVAWVWVQHNWDSIIRLKHVPAFRESIVWEFGAAILFLPAVLLSFTRGTRRTDDVLTIALYALVPLVVVFVALGVARFVAWAEDRMGIPKSMPLPDPDEPGDLFVLLRYVVAHAKANRGKPFSGRKRSYYAKTVFWSLLLVLLYLAFSWR